MTKHPQSTLGYAVNGVVVFRPPKRPPRLPDEQIADRPAAGLHCLRGNARKQYLKQHAQQNSPVRSRRNFSEAIVEIWDLQKSNPAAADLMENLKNASKTGDYLAAYGCATKLAKKIYGYNAQGVHFARSFFLPTIENREAVYYAAHSGQFQMLRLFLATWVVSKVRNSQAKRTILQWFKAAGFPDTYNKSRYRQTILNALSREAQHIMEQQVFTLNQLKQIVRESLFEDALKGRCAEIRTAKKKKRPKLVMDERFDPYTEGFSDEDASYAYDDDDDDEYKDGGALVPKGESSQDRQEKETKCSDSGENTQNVDSLNLLISDLTALQTKSDDIGIDDADSVVSLEWSIVSGKVFEGASLEERAECVQDDWSVVSDILSVQSIDTEGNNPARSYAEILKRAGGNSALCTTSKLAMPTLTEEPNINSQKKESRGEDFNDVEEFDADFFRDGFKQGRAGRRSLRFKGNQRTPKTLSRRLYEYW